MRADCKFVKFCFKIKRVDVNRCKFDDDSEKKSGEN